MILLQLNDQDIIVTLTKGRTGIAETGATVTITLRNQSGDVLPTTVADMPCDEEGTTGVYVAHLDSTFDPDTGIYFGHVHVVSAGGFIANFREVVTVEG